MSRLRRRPAPATVISLIALFVALGGTSYAAVSITGKNIKNSSLTGTDVKNSSLTGKDVKNNSLTGSDVKSLKGGDVTNNSLTGADVKNIKDADVGADALTARVIKESTLGQVPNAVNADKAKDSDLLQGKSAAQLQTASSSDTRSASVNLTGSDQVVLSTTVTLPAAGRITGFASVEVGANGGNNDNVNCNMNIDAVGGARQSSELSTNSVDQQITLPLTQQSATLQPGAHTVTVECNNGLTSASVAHDRVLTVVTTG